jgi:hypothetical protein
MIDKVKQSTFQVRDFISRNKKLILLVLLLLIGFIIYNSIGNNYHKKEIKKLEEEITVIQDQFEEAVAEKERYKDSSELYEFVAETSGIMVDALKIKAEEQRKEKEKALTALRNLPKDVIDTFFITRYANVTKSDTGLELDKNVGNEIIVELVEKDHLVGELATAENLSNTLSTQVKSLETSLMFSKAALTQADSAITLKSKQFDLSQQVNDMLKKDLKTAKKKAFWNQWKGAGVGVAAGLVVGLIAK